MFSDSIGRTLLLGKEDSQSNWWVGNVDIASCLNCDLPCSALVQVHHEGSVECWAHGDTQGCHGNATESVTLIEAGLSNANVLHVDTGIEEVVLATQLPEGPEVQHFYGNRPCTCVGKSILMFTGGTYQQKVTKVLCKWTQSSEEVSIALYFLLVASFLLLSWARLSSLPESAWFTRIVYCVCTCFALYSRKRKSEEVVGSEVTGKKRKVCRWTLSLYPFTYSDPTHHTTCNL